MNFIVAAISDQVWIALIGALVTMVGAAAPIILALRSVRDEIKTLKENNDGKLDELAKALARANVAEGKELGKAEQKAETAAETPKV